MEADWAATDAVDLGRAGQETAEDYPSRLHPRIVRTPYFCFTLRPQGSPRRRYKFHFRGIAPSPLQHRMTPLSSAYLAGLVPRPARPPLPPHPPLARGLDGRRQRRAQGALRGRGRHLHPHPPHGPPRDHGPRPRPDGGVLRPLQRHRRGPGHARGVRRGVGHRGGHPGRPAPRPVRPRRGVQRVVPAARGWTGPSASGPTGARSGRRPSPWGSRPTRRRPRPRGSSAARGPRTGPARTLLALLQPALQAGVGKFLHALGRPPSDPSRARLPPVAAVLDGLAAPVWLYDEVGRLLYHSGAASRLVLGLVEGAVLQAAAEQHARALLRGRGNRQPVATACAIEVGGEQLRLVGTFLEPLSGGPRPSSSGPRGRRSPSRARRP